MATLRENAPYRQSRAAEREIYGSRRIDARAPNVSPGYNPDRPGSRPGLTSNEAWKAFFHKKDTPPNAQQAPMLWQRMRENTTRANVGAKPIGDQNWAKIRQDTNPTRMMQSPLAPEEPPDVSGIASLYEPPPQFGGPRNLLMDPGGYGSFDDPFGGSSAFLRKYGRMRDLTTLGQDSWTL